MRFTKMHGCGNDYIYINGAECGIPAQDKPELVQRLSDRHFGIGGDGVIFINPSDEADFEMEMYNADGSRAEMCGNGIRCVAKYVYDKGLTDRTQISIVSAGKIKYLTLTVENGKVSMVRVDMGRPELTASLIPVVSEHDQAVDEEITVDRNVYRMTCVSMGNPHAVVFTDDVANLDLTKIGPHFEQHERFPKRINTEFVRVIDRHTVEMRVWERGTGETLACGTGCCATAVACVLNGKTEADVTVKVLGGEIRI
ncbi:MAG: diaminopimelate epimerase, partial [Lachnospiraceae bacterium]|nr:diaminopimelate epimerase [Lachnospiraceae bacterium]